MKEFEDYEREHLKDKMYIGESLKEEEESLNEFEELQSARIVIGTTPKKKEQNDKSKVDTLPF